VKIEKKYIDLVFINGAKEVMERKRYVQVAPPNKNSFLALLLKVPNHLMCKSIINKVCIHFEVHKENLDE
jgi:hypothetical protein